MRSSEMERILHIYVARLRSDPATPSAHGIEEAELEDHLATFLSDTADTLAGMDLAAGAESESLRDGTSIQRTISQRHGKQRARLGWSEVEIRREYSILREEIAAAIRRQIQRERWEEVEEAIEAVKEFLRRGERVSLQSHRNAAERED